MTWKTTNSRFWVHQLFIFSHQLWTKHYAWKNQALRFQLFWHKNDGEKLCHWFCFQILGSTSWSAQPIRPSWIELSWIDPKRQLQSWFFFSGLIQFILGENNEIWEPRFFKHNNSSVETVSCIHRLCLVGTRGHILRIIDLLFSRFLSAAIEQWFVAFCSFFPCSLTVFHRGKQWKSGSRQWKSSRADKQHCFP